jgi:hypothetical protein
MTPTADSLQGFRNRLINSDMRIDQRNAGAAVTLTGIDSEFPVDRFKFTSNTTASLALQQVADAPQGFVNSIRATVNTADASPAVGVWMEQPIEGLNVSDLGWGTANAQAVTISFWVKSTLTGTFGASLQNSARNRSYPFTYAISAANTWEQKTVTVAGDTSGTWLTTNGVGIYVISDLGLTGSLRGTAGSWAAADYRGVTSAVSVIGTLNATWQITGVQLEAGSVATPFERRPYGTELALCQRYFFRWANDSGVPVYDLGLQAYSSSAAFGKLFDFPVVMRSAPTATVSGSFQPHNASGSSQTAFTGIGGLVATTHSLSTGDWNGSTGLVAGNATMLRVNTNAVMTVSAEL